MASIFNLNKFTKIVTITLTQACNLNCIYCYECHKSTKFMSFEKAKEIIDKELTSISKDKNIQFDLFGGEPFLNFQLIKQIVGYVEEKYNDYNVMLFIATNGTLLTKEIKEWLKSKTQILQCGLSLDGTKEMHDYNRDNSFDLIDLDFFANTYPEQIVKMTISQYSLKKLYECVKFCHEKGFQVSCNLAYGLDWSNKENVSILEEELLKLINYYLENLHIKPCSILDRPISSIAVLEKQAIRTCGAGWNMIAYDVDGESYPCQFFMPLSVGKEKAEKSKTLNFNDEIIGDDKLDPKCTNCVVKAICPRCSGSNYMQTGNIYLQDDNMCKLNKIIFKARAYFKAKLYEKGVYNDCSEGEINALLKSIILINDNL